MNRLILIILVNVICISVNMDCCFSIDRNELLKESVGHINISKNFLESGDQNGLLIDNIHNESVLSKIGLKNNDIIVLINEKKARTVEDYIKMLGCVEADALNHLKIIRNGNPQILKIELIENVEIMPEDRPERIHDDPDKSNERNISVDFKSVNILTIISFIERLYDIQFIVDPVVKGKASMIISEKIPINEVYDIFLSVIEEHGFTVVEDCQGIKIEKR